jgi:hypothetical protein
MLAIQRTVSIDDTRDNEHTVDSDRHPPLVTTPETNNDQQVGRNVRVQQTRSNAYLGTNATKTDKLRLKDPGETGENALQLSRVHDDDVDTKKTLRAEPNVNCPDEDDDRNDGLENPFKRKRILDQRGRDAGDDKYDSEIEKSWATWRRLDVLLAVDEFIGDGAGEEGQTWNGYVPHMLKHHIEARPQNE